VSIRRHAALIALAAAVTSTAQSPVPQPRAPGGIPPRIDRAPGLFAAPDAANAAGRMVKKAYEQLFQVQNDLTRVPPGAPGVKTRSVVCGLTIWNVDPDLDPRIRLRPPQPPNVTYAIRRVTPPVCQE